MRGNLKLVFSSDQQGLFGPMGGGPAPARAPRKKTGPAYYPPEPPKEPGGRWKVHPNDIAKGFEAWADAYARAWPSDPRFPRSGRDIGQIKHLVEMYGPEVWAQMAACVCACWQAIRENYRLRAVRPVLGWVLLNRAEVAAAVAAGGFTSRSYRTGWNQGQAVPESDPEAGHGW